MTPFNVSVKQGKSPLPVRVPTGRMTSAMLSKKTGLLFVKQLAIARYESSAALDQFRAIYADLRLNVNFFQPVLKLVHKERQGSIVHKRYDETQTPHQRIMASPNVSTKDKLRLQHSYLQLNPAALRRQIDAKLRRLGRLTG